MKTKCFFTSVTLSLMLAFNCAQAQTFFPGDTLKKKNFQITTDFLAPMTGNFTLGLESYVGNGLSLDIRIGLIGIGKVDYFNQLSGIFVKVQPNFYITPNYKPDNYAVQSNFQGTYFSPVLIIGGFSYTQSTYYSHGENQITTEALLINLGHQFVYRNTISFNVYGGAGYSAVQSKNANSYYNDYLFSHARIDGDLGFTVDGGFEIGILFK